MPGSEKLDGVNYLRKHAEQVVKSSEIVVIGGGAVGVQMATDIKELYPDKSVTLVHSRKTVMNRFHYKLHDIIEERCKELGIKLKLGSRVKVPKDGYPTDGSRFDVEFEDGSKIPADFAVELTPIDEVICIIANAIFPDHLHRHGSPIEYSSITFTRLDQCRRFHPNFENLANQRSRTPQCLRSRRCCSHGRSQSSQTVSPSLPIVESSDSY